MCSKSVLEKTCKTLDPNVTGRGREKQRFVTCTKIELTEIDLFQPISNSRIISFSFVML